MKQYPQFVIRDKRVVAIKRRHPWIFSGAIYSHDDCENGDVVEVITRKGEFLAIGYYQDSSIMIRILSFKPITIDRQFWINKIQDAFSLRMDLNLPSKHTNVYRLIHGEGDGVPGLIIDIYSNVAVIQCHAIGIHRYRHDISTALQEVLGEKLEAIFFKSGKTLPLEYVTDHPDEFVFGEAREVMVQEHNCKFIVDVISGQKTGFFIDQRENRKLLQSYASGKSVLNLFSYTGGFSVYALQGGARNVVSVDVSGPAIAICDRNIELSKKSDTHTSIKADVNDYLKEIPNDSFDMIIVDPPAFAKSSRKKHNAVQAYKRLNAAAISKIKSGGFIFTFSCSQVVDGPLFYNTIVAASIDAGRPCQVIHHLSQGPDHPVSIFHPEGNYLKGLVLKVR